MSKYAIVTGDSRGLGEEVAKLFLESGVNVVGISRTRSITLPNIAKENNLNYDHHVFDVSRVSSLEDRFSQILDEILKDEMNTLYLVNNAATVEPMNLATNIKSLDLIRHVNINSIAPMILTSQFLKKATEKGIPGIAVSVTSGAANRPIYGWSAYCSTKASIDMYTKTVALEQEEQHSENKVIAFNPGVMDTEMQAVIRSSSEEEFKDVKRYQDLKENNQLNSPQIVAGVLIDILYDEDMVNGKIYDVKNYL